MSCVNERLRDIQRYSGLTIKEMAEKINVTVSSMSYYLKDRDPNTDVLIRVSKEFNVSINWLLGVPNEDRDILYDENVRLKTKLLQIMDIIKTIQK